MTHKLPCLTLDPKQVLASAAGATSDESKPNAIISFSGDAEDGSDDDEEENAPEEEKEDDFQIAWEVLETAKMLYESKLEGKMGKAVSGQGPAEDTSIERKIADVCDLLGEVSIENGTIPFLLLLIVMLTVESFDAAVQDLTRALELKVNIYEPSNPIISEAHYKLSLALEFAQQPSPEHNKSLALEHLESAIESVKQRVKVLESEGKSTEAADAQEMIDELNIKVEEMKNPPKEELDVGSMFGSGGGFSEVLQAKLAETLKGGANDLTGLVRKKEKPSTGEASGSTGEKRKIEGDTAVGSPGKKVRVEDVEDE
jgi:HAT1-interacting factor 1